MRGWVKRFEDGKKIYGTDDKVLMKKISWSKGRLEGIVGVDVYHDEHLMVVDCGLGKYWQSDDMVAMFAPKSTVPGRCVVRRVCRKIREDDVGCVLVSSKKDNTTTYKITMSDEGLNQEIITDAMVGKWFIFELDTDTFFTRCYLSERRI